MLESYTESMHLVFEAVGITALNLLLIALCALILSIAGALIFNVFCYVREQFQS